jgi:hypothetical protein
MDPNAVFQKFFDWFIIKYGCTLAEDHKTNQMAMATSWHPSMEFEVLTLHLFCRITFASLSGHSVTNKDRVNISIRVLNRTGIFPKEYKTWILCGRNASKRNDFVSFKTFWDNAVQITLFTTVLASQHRYGMAITNNDALAHLLKDAVLTFGMAAAATQESL